MPDFSPSHPSVGWEDGSWRADDTSAARLEAIAPGEWVTVVKRDPEGQESTRYPARKVRTSAPAPWIELVATWVVPDVAVAGLEFVPGDTVREFFSALHPYNAFAVISPEGDLRGWYGNVTYPAFLETVNGETVLVWHDLYLDVVTLPDGSLHLLDDDELASSGLPAQHATFAEAIHTAREDLIALISELNALMGL